ncbi:MAG: hypothetical protein Q9213_007586 [Squamulea squamosa]
MPIKWTAERDQTLLLKIVEIAGVSADVKAISEAWPSHEEAPTPRAIQEHIHKLRAQFGLKGSGKFKMVGTVGSRGGTSSVKSSPAKSSPAKPSAPGTKLANGGKGNKRKRADDDGNDSDSSAVTYKAEKAGSDVDDAKAPSPAPMKKPAKKAAKNQANANSSTVDTVKEEFHENMGMDGVTEGIFTMPAEI